MRITAHVPDDIARDVKTFADNKNQSVSSIVAEAIKHYISEETKKELGMKVLALAGKTRVSKNIYEEMDRGRKDSHDRT
jgi:metal-responsive CopG/Arc/MetJ family transcriptional regulator